MTRFSEARNGVNCHNRRPDEITVGIMGMGVLGQDAARKLKTLGFNVIGWSRTKKQIDGIKVL